MNQPFSVNNQWMTTKWIGKEQFWLLWLIVFATHSSWHATEPPRLAGWSRDVHVFWPWRPFNPRHPSLRFGFTEQRHMLHIQENHNRTDQRGSAAIGQNRHGGACCGQQRWNASLRHGAPWPLQHATCPLEARPLCLVLLCPGKARTKKTSHLKLIWKEASVAPLGTSFK